MLYIKDEDLLEEMVLSKEFDKLSDKANEMLLMIADSEIRKCLFISEIESSKWIYKKCLSDVNRYILMYWRRYNPNRGKCRVYFVNVIGYGIKYFIKNRKDYILLYKRREKIKLITNGIKQRHRLVDE